MADIHLQEQPQGFLVITKRRLRRAPPTAWFGMTVLTLYLAAALFAPLIAPYGEYQIVSQTPFEPWSRQFIFGTDQLGRDLFSRLIFGAHNSISIAFLTTALAFLIGGSLGIVAATLRGVTDQALSRLVDSLMSIPDLIFTLMLLAIFGTSAFNLILILAAIDSTRVFQLSRATALDLATLEFR
ncbi:MAG: ABC transporter permease [Rhizobiaceae bacterium]